MVTERRSRALGGRADRGLSVVASLLAGLATIVACTGRVTPPRTTTSCMVRLSEGGEIECSAPGRAFDGDRCTCVAVVGGPAGPSYLGRVRTRVVEPESKTP
jgi:hypothetical protein